MNSLLQHIKDPAAQRIYTSYIKRVQRSVKSLPKADQDDVVMEWNSHIYEGLQRRSNEKEVDAILNITEKLGEPEEALKALVADKKLDQAVRSFNPKHVVKALALNIGNGIAYFIFAILYLLLFSFGFLIIMKLIHGDEVGMFLENGSFVLLGWGNGTANYTEVLGNWFIPVMVLAAALFYFIITLGLRLKRTLNKK